VAGALDLLDEEVERLGRSVGGAGGVVGQDLGAPAGEGPAEGADLGYRVDAATLDRLSMSSWASWGSSVR